MTKDSLTRKQKMMHLFKRFFRRPKEISSDEINLFRHVPEIIKVGMELVNYGKRSPLLRFPFKKWKIRDTRWMWVRIIEWLYMSATEPPYSKYINDDGTYTVGYREFSMMLREYITTDQAMKEVFVIEEDRLKLSPAISVETKAAILLYVITIYRPQPPDDLSYQLVSKP